MKLVLIDAHNYLHRAYHAIPPSMVTSKGEPVNAVYGFTRMLLKIFREQKPDLCAVCFDAPGPTFRDKIYPEYKATRKEIDPELRSQFPLSRDVVKAMNLALLEVPGYEADDIIATLARRAEKDGFESVIVSGDKDILQLVNDNIKVLNESKNTFFDEKKVKEAWGVAPAQIQDILMLIGDHSDNVPGVPGVGEKTAVKWIQDFGSVDNLLQNTGKLTEKMREKVLASRETLKMGRELIQLNESVPLPVEWADMKVNLKEAPELVPLFRKLQFNSLINDLTLKGVLSSAPSAPAADVQYTTVLSMEAVKDLAQKLGEREEFALDLETTGLNVRKLQVVGLSFAWEKDKAFYIPVGHRYLGAPDQPDLREVLNLLRPALENPKIRKIGQNLKYDYSVLRESGIETQNLYFDTMIASYCLDPSRKSHGLKDLVQEFLGRTMTRIEELFADSALKSSDGELPMEQVPVEKAAAYAAADADCTYQLYLFFKKMLKEKEAESLFYDLEMPLVPIIAAMERKGIRVDVPYLKQLGKEFAAEIQTLEKRAHELAGQEFNLNSSKQLAFILFEKLKLPAAKKTKTGFSTNEEVLAGLSAMHELPRILLRHRELAKLKSTYADGLLLEVVEKTSRVHTSFNQAGTATGRLSSSDPNMQNIPIRTELGRKIRKSFVPEPGNIFVSADYSQIDLRVLAHLSSDESLRKAFRSGEDIHRATAAEVFHVGLREVSSEQRSRAKAINFGIVYGQQAFGLSQSLGIPMKEAQDLIDRYFQRYPRVKEWIENIKVEARKNGYVKTLLGRRRYIPEIESKNGAMRAFAERVAMNTPVQGTSADIIKAAMIKIAVHPEMKSDCQMLLQVHDDLLFECPKSALEKNAKIIQNEMENAIQLSIPVLVDVKFGGNWAEMESIKP